MLLNITGGINLTLFEVNEAAGIIAEAADPDANIIFGAVIDENLKEEIRVTVIATGFDQHWAGFGGEPETGKVQDNIIKPISKEGDVDIPEFLRRRRS